MKRALIINRKGRKLTPAQAEKAREFHDNKELVAIRDTTNDKMPELEIINFETELDKVNKFLNDLG